jgi:hypothetical protein
MILSPHVARSTYLALSAILARSDVMVLSYALARSTCMVLFNSVARSLHLALSANLASSKSRVLLSASSASCNLAMRCLARRKFCASFSIRSSMVLPVGRHEKGMHFVKASYQVSHCYSSE